MSTDNLDKVGQKSNSKIGRPTKTGQEEQFKRCYLDNRKKFELECELLVCIHELFFEEIPTHPVNYRVSVNEIFSLFQTYNCLPIYRTLLDVNELYFKNSSICPDERLRYTSIIDVCYMLKQVKQQLGRFLNCYSLILLVLFFLL